MPARRAALTRAPSRGAAAPVLASRPTEQGGGRHDDAAALLQAGIVLASAGIVTGTVVLAWVAGALGAAGAALSAATYAGLV